MHRGKIVIDTITIFCDKGARQGRSPNGAGAKGETDMTKKEFDELSAKMIPGVSGCADYMWEEIERTYMGTEISKEGMVKVYWTDPGMYRVLRDAANKRAELERQEREWRKRAQEAEKLVSELKADNLAMSKELARIVAKVAAIRAAVA